MRTFKRALITGITGSGGSYLAEYIRSKHPEVEIFGISRKNCDLTEYVFVEKELRDMCPDVIFHLASDADVYWSFQLPQDYLQNNIIGTCNLFEAVRKLKQDPLILHCSTSEVYGQVDPKNVPIAEDCPINPVSPYAISKAAQDFLAKTYFDCYGQRIIRTRMFGYINPRRSDLFATAFARQIVRIEKGGKRDLVYGNLNSVRTLIDVRDAVRAYWDAATLCEPGEAYNMGGGISITVGEVLERLLKKATVPIPTKLNPELLRPKDITLQIPNCGKFLKKTNWKPEYSFEESLDFLLAYCRDHI